MPSLSRTDPPLVRFVSQLWESGRVEVPELTGNGSSPLGVEELNAAEEVLHRYEAGFREQLPGDPPEWNSSAALWGLEMLYQASSYLLHRDASVEVLRSSLSRPCPEKPSAGVCYSVDLSFRFLPDLQRMVTEIARNDPLCDILETWGMEWPLSSVGGPIRRSIVELGDPAQEPPVQNTTELPPSNERRGETVWDLSGFWEHETLRRVYLDRILIAKDLSRLNDPRVALAAREALGNYPSLATEVAWKIESDGKEAGKLSTESSSISTDATVANRGNNRDDAILQ